jgi:hypothetical protein
MAFIRQAGFPRRWSAVRDAAEVALITQEHALNRQGKSVFRYRAMRAGRELGLFTTLRQAKQAVTAALDA